MRRVRFVALLLVVALGAMPVPQAGAVGIAWQRPVGIALNSVAEAPDGSVYAAGTRRVSATTEAILTKFSASGARMWTHGWLPSPAYSTQGVAVSVRPDGTVVWTGNVQAGCDGGAWFLETVTPGGDTIDHLDRRGSICGSVTSATGVVAKGNVVAVSLTRGSCCGAPFSQRGLVWGFSHRLTPRWRAPFYAPGSTASHFIGRATGVAIGPGGDVLVAGWVARASVSGLRPPLGVHGTAVLEKLLTNGGVSWSRRVGNAPMDGLDTPVAIAIANRSVFLTAAVGGVDARWRLGAWGPSYGWLGRLTLTGDLVWARRWDFLAPFATSAASPRRWRSAPGGRSGWRGCGATTRPTASTCSSAGSPPTAGVSVGSPCAARGASSRARVSRPATVTRRSRASEAADPHHARSPAAGRGVRASTEAIRSWDLPAIIAAVVRGNTRVASANARLVAPYTT